MYGRPIYFDLDFLIVECAFPQTLAEFLTRCVLIIDRAVTDSAAARRRQQDIQDAILGRILGAHTHSLHRLFTPALDGNLRQIADDRFDIASNITDFGKLRRLDLDEWGIGQPRQAPCDFRFANARRPNH